MIKVCLCFSQEQHGAAGDEVRIEMGGKDQAGQLAPELCTFC